jgi:hypothetical protein
MDMADAITWAERARCKPSKENWVNNKRRLEHWRRKMRQFHLETQEGLGAFGIAVIRAEDAPSLAQSKDRDAVGFTNAVIKWQGMVESRIWQLCLACDYKFRSAMMA